MDHVDHVDYGPYGIVSLQFTQSSVHSVQIHEINAKLNVSKHCSVNNSTDPTLIITKLRISRKAIESNITIVHIGHVLEIETRLFNRWHTTATDIDR